MPGMMDTILNLGLNDTTVAALAARSGNPRFAWDCYRRFVAMYGEVVLGVVAPSEHDEPPFDVILEEVKLAHKAARDQDLGEPALRELVARFKAEVKRATGAAFPDDVTTQLWGAIGAVFRSWNNPRADYYRKLHGIPATMGTAVNVQAMVFGNLGDDCATGVAFTRNPATGTAELYGEFLTNAQGEDVVAGIRTPEPITELAKKLPAAHAELVRVAKLLEDHFRDMQDLEFTIQSGELFMLQTRSGKRTGKAMVKVAVDLVGEGKLTPREAVLRIDPAKLDEVLHPTIDPKARPPDDRQGPAGVAGRRDRPDRVHRERRRGLGRARRDRAAGPHRHLARGHPRHEGGRGDPDLARRHDVARRGRRARHGQVLRDVVHLAAGRRREADRGVRRRRQGAQAQGGRHPDARRLDRRGVPRPGAAGPGRSSATSSAR